MAVTKLLIAFPLIATLFMPCAAIGADQADFRKPLIYGICQKPFPAMFALDYPLCRARAWLAALAMAASRLPDVIEMQLKREGFATSLGRLAAAALVCPLDVVTPEYAPGNEIRVFLTWPDDPQKRFESMSSNFMRMPAEMAVIWETQHILAELREGWPVSVQDAGSRLPELEGLTNRLKILWQARAWLAEEGGILTASEGSAIVALLQENGKPSHGELELALDLLLVREATDLENAQLWGWLVSHALYLRGLYHAGAAQPALAETDFDAALLRRQKTGIGDDISSLYIARGNVRRARHNEEGMCSDYSAACAHGECGPLSLARREGLCIAGGE